MSKALLTLLSALSVTFLTGAKPYVIVAEPYPPYEFSADGKTQGMDVEILSEAAKLAAVDLRFEFVPWTRALAMVQAGEADGIMCLNQNAERDAFLYFPKVPLSIERLRIFRTPQQADVASLSELEGKQVGTIQDYTYGDAFDGDKKIAKDPAADQDLLVKKLVAGRFPYAVHNEVAMIYAARTANLSGSIKACTLVVQESPLYIGFSKKSAGGKELFEKISTALDKMRASGALEAIQKKYTR